MSVRTCSYYEVVPGDEYDCPPNRWEGYVPGTSGPTAHPLEARMEAHGIHLCRECGYYLIESDKVDPDKVNPKWPTARVMIAVRTLSSIGRAAGS